MKPTYLQLDNLDDRRELWHLLHRLPPERRLRYLCRCCEAVKDGMGNGLFPTPAMWEMLPEARRSDRGDERLTNSIYTDLVHLAAHRPLDLVKVALELEKLAQSGELLFPAPRALAC